MSDLLRIGVSSCFFHADPQRPIFKNKTLLYFEESMVRMILSYGAIPLVLPRKFGKVSNKDILNQVDGLLLQGGSDMSPASYGEEPLKPEWSGDQERDEYEIALIQEAMNMDKPILGICRGLQVINVALGGSLYQDIETQLEKAHTHRDWELYDRLTHEIVIETGTHLDRLYTNKKEQKIISIHHQAIKDLGKDLVVEALSKEDHLIEAIRYQNPEKSIYAFAVQWHPEFQSPEDSTLMDYEPIINDFLEASRERK